MLFVVASGTMIGTVLRFSLSPMLPTIIETLAITPSKAGVALSLMFGLSALARFPGGRLSDQLNRKSVLVFSSVAMICAAIALTLSTTYAIFLVSVALVGIGGGFYPPAAIAHLSDLFTTRRGQALGINNAMVYLGGMIAGQLAIFVLAIATWRVAFLPVIGGFALVALFFHTWNTQSYTIERANFELRSTFARLVQSSDVLGILVVAALFSFSWQSIIGFLPTFLQRDLGYSPTFASNAFAGLYFVGIFSNLLAGSLGERFQYLHVIAGAALFAIVGVTSMLASQTTPALIASLGVMAVGLSAFWPALQAYVMSLLPDVSRGGDFGAFSSIYLGIGSLGPTYVGVVAERADYRLAFRGLVVCLGVTLVVVLWQAAKGER
jgi:MFS family permease